MANVFGTTYPTATSATGPTTIDFTYGVVTKSEPTTEYVEHKSQLTGDRELINRGCHWTVEIRYHLYKHTAGPSPTEFYNTLVGLKGLNDFTLKLHNDGATFKHSTGVSAKFCLKEIVPFYLTTTDYKDGLIITFESVDTVIMELA